MDLSRAAMKNTSHGDEVLPQDVMHIIQRPYYQWGGVCQDPAGNRTTRRPPDNCRDTNWSGMDTSPVYQVWQKPSCKEQWKGEEDKADSRRGGKATSSNGQAWSSPSPRGQLRTEKGCKLIVKSSSVPQRPPRGYGRGEGEGDGMKLLFSCGVVSTSK